MAANPDSYCVRCGRELSWFAIIGGERICHICNMATELDRLRADNQRQRAKIARLVSSRGRLLSVLEKLGVDGSHFIGDDSDAAQPETDDGLEGMSMLRPIQDQGGE